MAKFRRGAYHTAQRLPLIISGSRRKSLAYVTLENPMSSISTFYSSVEANFLVLSPDEGDRITGTFHRPGITCYNTGHGFMQLCAFIINELKNMAAASRGNKNK